MATQEQLELSSFIKGVHSTLRNKSKKLGYDKAWNEHIGNKKNLEKYASSMKTLATKYWNDNEKNNTKVISRIDWVYTFIKEYFSNNELEKHRLKEQEILAKLGITITGQKECPCFSTSTNKPAVQQLPSDISSSKLDLLDVGSCYNPFKIYDCFNIVAIDIAPESQSDNVYKCDFINVKIGEGSIFCKDSLTSNSEEIIQLCSGSYHIIVFSLFLEYLPSPEQRITCCEKAYNLLKNEGILVIITPDSKHVGANAKYMKSWRYVLSQMGFSRIKYEKLPYLHCMVFRKSINIEIPKRWASLNANKDFFQTLNIPQDFQVETEINPTNTNTNSGCHETENISLPECNLLDELPFIIK